MSDLPPGPSGDFRSWLEAEKLCTFDQPEFLDKVFSSAIAVAEGAAVHVRDGSLFDEIIYSWPLLAGLLFAATSGGGKLAVLDFGGAIATTYLQNRRFLDRLVSVEWHIIEKATYCDFADRNLHHPRFHFYRSIDACIESGANPNVALFSAVLQFLPDPWNLLSQVRNLPVSHVLIDRCPINEADRDRLTVFRAHPGVYANVSRPMWFFKESRLLASLEQDFQLVERFPSFEEMPEIPSRFYGYILQRRGS